MRLIIADIVFWFHWIWIVGYIIAFLLSFSYPILKPIFNIMIATTITGQILFLGCPLVVLEEKLRGNNGFQGGFMAYWIEKTTGYCVPDYTIASILILTAICFTIYNYYPKLRGLAL